MLLMQLSAGKCRSTKEHEQTPLSWIPCASDNAVFLHPSGIPSLPLRLSAPRTLRGWVCHCRCCLPSSRLSGSVLCSLTPATSCGSANKESSCVWCVQGQGEALAWCPDIPTAWGPCCGPPACREKSNVPVEQGLRQLGLREGGNGESHK